MEKLFVQIFERKNWIIEQAKHQASLFDQHLASKLIIDGIVPPPWLHSPFLPPHVSNFEVAEVNTNVVSGVEFARSPLETYRSSLNEGLVEEGLQHRSNEEAGFLNGHSGAGIRPSVLPHCDKSDAGFDLNCTPHVGMSPFSPQGREGVVSENYQDPTLSLARLHRSKSRQRALELRNSVKSARCQSRCENKNDSVAGGIMGSAISLLQADHEDESRLAKPSSSKGVSFVEEETTDKITIVESNELQSRSIDVGSSVINSSKDEGLCVAEGSMQNSRQRALELRNSVKSARCQSRCENKNDSVAGGIMGSAISLLQADHEDESRLAKPSSSKGVSSVEEETTDKITIVESNELQSRSIDVGSSVINSSKDEGLCVAEGSMQNSCQVNEQFDSPSSSGKIEECEEGLGQECNFDNAEESNLQCSSLDVDKSSCISPEDGRACPGSSKLHSDQVNEQLDLSKPSSGSTAYCEETILEHCRSQEYNIGNALQPGSQHSSKDVDDSSCIDIGDGRLLDMSKPSSINPVCCEETILGHCRSEECNLENVQPFGSQYNSQDVVNSSSYVDFENVRSCPIESSVMHSDQVEEQLDVSRFSSGSMECCEEEILGHFRSQECKFNNAQQSGMQPSSQDVDNSQSLSFEDGSIKQHSDQVNEPLESSGLAFVNIECHEEGLEDYKTQDNNIDIKAEQSGLGKISSSPMVEMSEKTSDKKPSTFLDDKRAVNEKEKCNSPLPKPLPQTQVDSAKEDKSYICVSKSHSEKRYEDTRYVNENAPSSADKSLQDYEKISACSLLQSDEPVEQSIFLKDGVSNLQFSLENVVETPLVDTVDASVLIRDSETFRDLMVMAPCVPSAGERDNNNIDNNTEQSGFDKIFSSPMVEVSEKTSEKKHPSFLDNKRVVNEKEKCNSPLPMPLPKIQVDSLKESYKGVSESLSEKKYEDMGYLNENALSLADKSLQGYEKVTACSLLQSDEPAEQSSFLKDGESNLRFSHENVVEIPPVDTDDASVLLSDTELFRDLMVMAPCVPSAGEGDSNLKQQLKNSGRSQCEDSDSFERCTGDFNSNHHCISTECQTTEKVVELKTFCSVSKTSSHEKQKMVELQLENGIPATLGLGNEKLQIINRSPLDKKLMQEFDYEKPVLEFQRLSFCEEDYPNVNISPVKILLLEKEAHLMRMPQSSSKLTVKEDLSRLGSNSRGTMFRNVMLQSQNLDTKENLRLGDNELPVDTRKTEGEDENEKLTFCSLITPEIQTSHYLGADKDMPALEGFLMQADDERPCISVGGIDFDKLDLPKCLIERASILEKLCKSACTNSPLSSSSEGLRLNKVTDLYHSLPNGLVESMDLKSNLLMNDENKLLKDDSNFLNSKVNCTPHGRSFNDCWQSFSSNSAGDARKPFASPFGKLLDRNSLNYSYSNSGKRSSPNIELPCISEEAENTYEVDDEFSLDMGSIERVPLTDITENENAHVTVSEAATFADRLSLESVNPEFSNRGNHNRTKENVGNQKKSKRKYLSDAVNHDILPGANGAKRVTRSSYNRYSRSDLSCTENSKGPRFSEKESKHKNIVSNVTSFIPLLQQREAPTNLKGKRDIKVKAIEAAEAAKRLAEKKENERHMKKEALKLERARMEQENLKQIELEKKKKDEERKKKEEERKKKEADMAAKKRQREEEDRKEKERKRMRVEEVRRRLREHGGKLRSDKENKEVKPQANDQKLRKGCKDATEKLDKESGHDNFDKLSVVDSKTSTIDAGRTSSVVEDSQTTSVGSLETEALENVMENRISETSEEQSYQISPYKASDDEDEDDDNGDILNNKFVPSWASKDRLAVLVASQKKLSPEIIFPPKSFCEIAEVLLPRQHQFK